MSVAMRLKRTISGIPSLAITSGVVSRASSQISCPVPSGYPLAGLAIICSGTFTTLGSAMSADGIFALFKNITLRRNSTVNPVPINISGPGAVEYAEKVLPSLDRNTLLEITKSPSNIATPALAPTNYTAGDTFRFVIPLIASRCDSTDLLHLATAVPLHLDGKDATLEMTIASDADMGLTSGTAKLSSLKVSVVAYQLLTPAALLSKLAQDHGVAGGDVSAANGFLEWVLQEQSDTFASAKGDAFVQLPSRLQITSTLIRPYDTATNLKKDPTDTTGTGFWELKIDQNTLETFLLGDLEAENDQTGSTAIVGAKQPQFPYSYHRDFMSPYGNPAAELGSLLNTDLAPGIPVGFKFPCTATSVVKTVVHGFKNRDAVNTWRYIKQ